MLAIKNASIYKNGTYTKENVVLSKDGAFVSVSVIPEDAFPIFHDLTIFPGFADVHVHLREPGFSYKERIETGTRAGAHGGYTAVCSMPNLNPVPDSLAHLEEQLAIIRKDACISVLPFAALTVGEMGKTLTDIEGLMPYVVGFSDDGKGVQSEELMMEAMTRIAKLGGVVSAHCEDESLLEGGYIHKGKYAEKHGHKGICSASEFLPLARDISLVKATGCRYHVCHVSTKESVDLIRRAKREGLPVTAETAPHYLVLDEDDLKEDGRYKMNPPLRSAEDREALIEGILDGTIDCIATDHAPHSIEEKAKGLSGSMMGIVGLETAFPILYTKLVLTGKIPLEKIISCLTENPRRIFKKLPREYGYSVWDLDEAYTIQAEDFESLGRVTPFLGETVKGRLKMTIVKGKIVWTA